MPGLKFALRRLAKSPGFTSVAVLTIALGIGATTTVCSWIDRVLLNPLPGVADVARIVAIETLAPAGETIDTSYPDFRDYRAQTNSFTGMLVFKERPLSLGEGDQNRRAWSQLVSGNFFEVLGVRPRLGRFFSEADRPDDPAANPVVVISEKLWRNHFGANPAIVGLPIKLNSHDFTVVGVAPADFLGSLNGLAFDLWVPVGLHARLLGPSHWLETRSWRSFHTLGRLAPGVTIESARAELAGLAAQLARAHPDSNQGIGFIPLPLARSPHGAQTLLAKPLLLLLGVTGLLLLIVCANLSNLLLVRASERQREMSIRHALGASRFQLAGQLLGESLLLALAGTLLGLLFTLWMSDLLRQFIPDATLPIALTAQLNLRVLGAAIAFAICTALLVGLAPVLWISRPNLMNVLRASSRVSALSRRAELFRRLLVVAQVATALTTLACAGLAGKSFLAAKHTHPGFEARQVLIAALKLDTSGYSRAQGLAFLDRLEQRLGTLPGVQSSALAEYVPLGLSRGSWEEIAAAGYVRAPGEDLRVYHNYVSPGYFSLMKIPLTSGRDFTDADCVGAPLVAIVSETFARRFFGGANAVGRSFSIWNGDRTLTVVGVARDIKVNRLDESAQPYFYAPLRQTFASDTGLAIHLRTATADPLTLLPALCAAVHELDARVPIFEATALEDYISAARFAQKAAASLLAVLAALALALTALGLYGVLAFAVAQRTPEIGLRLALGAQTGDVVRMVLWRGGALVTAGIGVGLIFSLGANRALAAVFYGLSAFEPMVLIAVVPPLVLIALLACWLPARRATKVDPIISLRSE